MPSLLFAIVGLFEGGVGVYYMEAVGTLGDFLGKCL